MRPTVKLVAVDDTPASLELIQESLEQEGLTIFTATDPEQGLDLVLQEHPQIVLLDLVMPKMSGLDLLREIKRHDESIEVIVMTGYPTIASAVEEQGAATQEISRNVQQAAHGTQQVSSNIIGSPSCQDRRSPSTSMKQSSELGVTRPRW